MLLYLDPETIAIEEKVSTLRNLAYNTEEGKIKLYSHNIFKLWVGQNKQVSLPLFRTFIWGELVQRLKSARPLNS